MSSSVREKMAQVNKDKLKAMRAAETVTEKVRARNDKGNFIPDDPSTPENEAWVEKPKVTKKPAAKKKAASKKSKQVQLNIKTPEIQGCFLKYWDMYLCFPLDLIKFQWENNMDSLHLADYLYKKLRQKREDLEVTLSTGNVQDFAEYRYIVGQVKGLTFMEDEIRTSMKNIEYSDD